MEGPFKDRNGSNSAVGARSPHVRSSPMTELCRPYIQNLESYRGSWGLLRDVRDSLVRLSPVSALPVEWMNAQPVTADGLRSQSKKSAPSGQLSLGFCMSLARLTLRHRGGNLAFVRYLSKLGHWLV